MYGLVLEGGGGKGAYQVGACRALKELGFEFGAVAGTSVGALNGALLIQDDLDKAYDFWYDIDPSKVIKYTEGNAEETAGSEGRSSAIEIKLAQLKRIILERGLNVEPLEKIVSETLDEKKIRDSGIDFGIVTYDLTGRKALEVFLEDIPDGKLPDYLIASASMPGFKLKKIDGRLFVDGGVYNCLPINLLKDRGYKDIIVIRTFGIGREKKIDTAGLNIAYIAPAENLGPMLDFRRERSRRNLKLGYFDTLKVFKGLKGKRYYIEPLNDENYFVRYLAEINDEKIRRVGALFGLEGLSWKRALFESIIPKLADLLDMPQEASYEDISIALIEKMAHSAGVDRFKVYTFNEIFDAISRNYKPAKNDFIGEIPGFLRRLDLVGKIVRDQIIDSITSILYEDIIHAPLLKLPERYSTGSRSGNS